MVEAAPGPTARQALVSDNYSIGRAPSLLSSGYGPGPLEHSRSSY